MPAPLGQRRGGKNLPRGRGFQPGAANVTAVQAAARREHAAQAAAEKAAAQALLSQRYHPDGLPKFQRGGRTEALSQREVQVLEMRAAGSAPLSVPTLAAELGRSETCIRKGLKRVREPETPPSAAEVKRRRGGRPRTLTPEDNAVLRAAFRKDPRGGGKEAANKLHAETGKRPSRWTVARELRRGYRPGEKAVRKRGIHRYAPLTPQLLSMQAGFIAATKAHVTKYGFERLHWQDETNFVPGTVSRQGYSSGAIYVDEKHSRYGNGEKVSIWGVMSHRGFLKLWVTEESGNDDTCRRFFCETQPDSDIGSDAPLFDLLPPSSFVLVDRLGRSGRCKFPIAEHYSPYIKARFNQAKKGYLCLPPSGALLNPIELAWCELKRRVCYMQPPGEPVDTWGQVIRGPRNLKEARVMIKAAALEMNAEPKLWRSFIHRRAEGCELHRRYGGTSDLAVAVADVATRAAFDLGAAAMKEQLVNIHASGDEPLTTVAQRASYARYFLAWGRAGCVGDLTPPAPADEPGTDGYEDCCRVCQLRHVALKQMRGVPLKQRGVLLSCERPSCTAAYHPHCLGLAGPPAGRWQCPGCVYTPGRAPRKNAPILAQAGVNLLAGLSDEEDSEAE